MITNLPKVLCTNYKGSTLVRVVITTGLTVHGVGRGVIAKPGRKLRSQQPDMAEWSG